MSAWMHNGDIEVRAAINRFEFEMTNNLNWILNFYAMFNETVHVCACYEVGPNFKIILLTTYWAEKMWWFISQMEHVEL